MEVRKEMEMKIYTTNRQGQKVAIEYSQEIITEPEIKPDIVINDYPTFKLCIQKSQEQKEYVEGDKRYEKALGELIHRDHALYDQFSAKLFEEYRSSKH